MYKKLDKVKLLSFLLMCLGMILFIIGYYINNQFLNNEMLNIKEYIKKNNNLYNDAKVSNIFVNIKYSNKDNKLLHKLSNQIKNRPWSAFYVSAYFFFSISTASLLFFSILNVSNSGWSVIISRVIEGLISFIPYGSFLVFFVILGSLLGYNHLFHWMENGITNFKKENFDLIIALKSNILNKPFFLIRILFYFIGFIFFGIYVKLASKKLDNDPTLKNYWNMYKKNVFVVVFCSCVITMYCLDLIMSIDVHWYSTLFAWYLMISHLVTSISCIILFSICLNKLGYLRLFNDNHLHDLAKYLFGFSLLWTYFWFSQFMLYWYANIPEEIVYFLDRYNLYKSTFFTMLIFNFLIPLLFLLSSSIKRNNRIVSLVSIIILFGHWLDDFNAIMPGTVGVFWKIGFLEIGSFLFIFGLFIFIVTKELLKLNLEPKGNPYFIESKSHHYLF